MDCIQEVKINFSFQLQSLASVQKGMTYSGIKIYNSLPSDILNLKNERKQFKMSYTGVF